MEPDNTNYNDLLNKLTPKELKAIKELLIQRKKQAKLRADEPREVWVIETKEDRDHEMA